MRLLAIETSTEACSIAVWDGQHCQTRHEVAPRRHAELALDWCEALLDQAGLSRAGLDAIAVGCGPGGFTGVRLGVALAQGMAFALDRPVVAISTLAVLAQSAVKEAQNRPVLAAIDARMGEVYAGLFRADATGRMLPMGDEWMCRPESIELGVEEAVIGVGTGFAASDEALVRRLGARLVQHDSTRLPHAQDLITLALEAFRRGEAQRWDAVEPAYLRNKVAQTLAERGVAS